MPEHEQPSRRRVLKAIALIGAAAAAGAAGRAAAQAKAVKSAVSYQDQPRGSQRCADCMHFIEGGECRVVEGRISPDGWCSLFTPKR
jgi:anaerobic selenocysteine-containing dehydrogenase